MHDNTLIAIAMSVSALGIVVLLIALTFLDIPVSTFSQVSVAADGDMSAVRADVVSTRQLEGRTLIVLRERTTLDAVIDENITLARGDCIVVRGKRTTYNDKPQLSATRIERCTK